MVLRDVCRVVVFGCVLVCHKQKKSEKYFDVRICFNGHENQV
jgi:hypothetical protein